MVLVAVHRVLNALRKVRRASKKARYDSAHGIYKGSDTRADRSPTASPGAIELFIRTPASGVDFDTCAP
jgi:hypothetical protein